MGPFRRFQQQQGPIINMVPDDQQHQGQVPQTPQVTQVPQRFVPIQNLPMMNLPNQYGNFGGFDQQPFVERQIRNTGKLLKGTCSLIITLLMLCGVLLFVPVVLSFLVGASDVLHEIVRNLFW
jgi:hypothetical protein